MRLFLGGSMFNVRGEVLAAENRICPYVRETMLDYSVSLSRLTGCQVYLKCENLQYTNAFKARGAMNKLLSLTPHQARQGVVTASSGNHGAAVAFGLNKLKIPGKIFLPEHASSTKVDNIRNYEVPIEFYGKEHLETELRAIEYAKQQNMIYVSPYNDPQVIGGQGTIGIEIARQLDKVDAVLVPVGGGGLIAGIAGYLKSVSPNIKMIGCLPENSPVMAESVKAGRIVEREIKPTLSDGTAGGIAKNAITFEVCRELVDEFILVSEDEIKNGILTRLKTQHMLVEGAAGVAVASLLKRAQAFEGKNVVVVLSGANISVETLKVVVG